MPITYYTSRPTFINGQRRGRGEPVDVSGFRQGAVQRMIDQGIIFPTQASNVTSGDIKGIRVVTESENAELEREEGYLYLVIEDPPSD